MSWFLVANPGVSFYAQIVSHVWQIKMLHEAVLQQCARRVSKSRAKSCLEQVNHDHGLAICASTSKDVNDFRLTHMCQC